ncbi:MAG: malonate-semialdehyde dehydrogenase (acetylating)/methylmalonate-semialdehyde dehydrogenase [Glaciecola sp.]|jgi:malonate-semialdehyde dehydrogenase (acetylating)/methylmalonate-semialdehyde dehydrogenase|uniref:aldehyde dehydrogenase family protein n=1 Tax=Congregibacter sp. TaxID=2744308 RepID=UPI0039E440C2
MSIQSTLLKAPLLINGDWLESQGEQTLPVKNPATQKSLGDVTFATADEVELAVASAKAAFETWRETPASERAPHDALPGSP